MWRPAVHVIYNLKGRNKSCVARVRNSAAVCIQKLHLELVFMKKVKSVRKDSGLLTVEKTQYMWLVSEGLKRGVRRISLLCGIRNFVTVGECWIYT